MKLLIKRLDRRTSQWIVVVTTDRHGLRRPILVQFLLLLSSLPSTENMTDRHKNNGPSRVFVPKHKNLEYGYWDYFSELHHKPAGRTVMNSVAPHLVRLPHLPSAAALRCHLRTITSMMDRHKLRRGSLLHFFTLKPPHSALDKFPAK